MTPPALERHLLDSIPLARAMALRIVGLVDGGLVMRAPLAENRNDKGCAFGGSLASLMTLAGWGVAVLRLDSPSAEIYVQDSAIDYLAPVWQDLVVTAWLDVEDDGSGFVRTYADKGRARARVRAQCRLDDGTVAATLVARFVAIDPARRLPGVGGR
jgi:thioesterase domain-containing protein